MVLAFVVMEITGESYAAFTRRLTRHPEVATALGFDRVPDESAFSRAWRNRFDNTAREYIETAAHFVVKKIHDDDIHAPEVRPKSEVIDAGEPENETDDEDSFSTAEIARTKRLAQSSFFALRTKVAPALYTEEIEQIYVGGRQDIAQRLGLPL